MKIDFKEARAEAEGSYRRLEMGDDCGLNRIC